MYARDLAIGVPNELPQLDLGIARGIFQQPPPKARQDRIVGVELPLDRRKSGAIKQRSFKEPRRRRKILRGHGIDAK